MKNIIFFLLLLLTMPCIAEEPPESSKSIRCIQRMVDVNNLSESDLLAQIEQSLRLVGLTNEFCPVNFITLQENESGAPVVYYSRYSSNTTDASIQQEIDQFVKKKNHLYFEKSLKSRQGVLESKDRTKNEPLIHSEFTNIEENIPYYLNISLSRIVREYHPDIKKDNATDCYLSGDYDLFRNAPFVGIAQKKEIPEHFFYEPFFHLDRNGAFLFDSDANTYCYNGEKNLPIMIANNPFLIPKERIPTWTGYSVSKDKYIIILDNRNILGALDLKTKKYIENVLSLPSKVLLPSASLNSSFFVQNQTDRSWDEYNFEPQKELHLLRTGRTIHKDVDYVIYSDKTLIMGVSVKQKKWYLLRTGQKEKWIKMNSNDWIQALADHPFTHNPRETEYDSLDNKRGCQKVQFLYLAKNRSIYVLSYYRDEGNGTGYYRENSNPVVYKYILDEQDNIKLIESAPFNIGSRTEVTENTQTK